MQQSTWRYAVNATAAVNAAIQAFCASAAMVTWMLKAQQCQECCKCNSCWYRSNSPGVMLDSQHGDLAKQILCFVFRYVAKPAITVSVSVFRFRLVSMFQAKLQRLISPLGKVVLKRYLSHGCVRE